MVAAGITMGVKVFNETADFNPSILFRLSAAFFFAAAFPIITILIQKNPSGMPPGPPLSGPAACIALSLGSFFITWGVYLSLTGLPNKNLFLLYFFGSFTLFTGLTVWLGLALHRDYFTHIFQLVLIYWLLFIFKNNLFASLHSKKQFYTFLFILNTVIFTTALLWIIFMGYAISTRQEPRWAESIVYNSYNTVLIFLLGAASLRLQLQRFRNIRVTGGDLYIDNWNFSRYFSETDKNIVIQFLTAEGNLTCFMLEDVIREGGGVKDGSKTKWSCRECIDKGYTTTRCPKYKNLYNRILNIKKLFETLEIGTIITPENKMQIKEEGWKLRLFDDVRVMHRHEPSAGGSTSRCKQLT